MIPSAQAQQAYAVTSAIFVSSCSHETTQILTLPTPVRDFQGPLIAVRGFQGPSTTVRYLQGPATSTVGDAGACSITRDRYQLGGTSPLRHPPRTHAPVTHGSTFSAAPSRRTLPPNSATTIRLGGDYSASPRRPATLLSSTARAWRYMSCSLRALCLYPLIITPSPRVAPHPLACRPTTSYCGRFSRLQFINLSADRVMAEEQVNGVNSYDWSPDHLSRGIGHRQHGRPRGSRVCRAVEQPAAACRHHGDGDRYVHDSKIHGPARHTSPFGHQSF